MTVGDGLSTPAPDLAACIDERPVRAVNDMVAEAMDAGAKKITRDFDLPTGAFCAPALLVDLPENVGLATDEVFGPAAAILRFDDEEEVLVRANSTEMGLAGYFFTRDQSRVWRMAEHLVLGITGINNALLPAAFAPIGGTKQSGLGREGAEAGLEEFEETRYLAIGL
ncbi:acyl-CoA reductase-like NAD-dependent aldehyde dehydrogenase [Rhodococcus opacus]|nr:acyl-CoA reductase-like NAD-dependent aldehyde dehydrogenase [Rhodococcus opacus]